jgi:hypothetical protein
MGTPLAGMAGIAGRPGIIGNTEADRSSVWIPVARIPAQHR